MYRRHLSAFLTALAVAALAFASAPALCAAAPLVVIDPGHGGPWSNANANGLREKNVALAISLALRDELVARGYRVVLTRQTDTAVCYGDIPTWNWNPLARLWSYRRDGHTGMDGTIPEDDLQARTDVANRLGADLFVCIHCNGSERRSVRGLETYSSARDALAGPLAVSVQRATARATGLADRGTFKRDFYVCRWTNMPAVLVECGYISNPYDAALLKQSAFRSRLARGIATGVTGWFAQGASARAAQPRIAATSTAEFAAAVSRATFPTTVPVAFVARSDRWLDAACVPSLASATGGPLLWIGPSGVDTATAAEIGRLAPGRLVAVGTAGSFTPETLASLRQVARPSTVVEELSAPDAPTLAAAVATKATADCSEVVIVSREDTVALQAAAPYAAIRRVPLLVAEKDGTLPPLATEWLLARTGSLQRATIVCASAALPSGIAAGIPERRVSSRDRAVLLTALEAGVFAHRTTGSLRPIVTSAQLGPEYLSSATRAGVVGMPFIAVSGRALPAKSRELITNNRSAIGGFEIHDAGDVPTLMDHMLRKADYL